MLYGASFNTFNQVSKSLEKSISFKALNSNGEGTVTGSDGNAYEIRSGVEYKNAKLRNVELVNASLEGAQLVNANLSSANLEGAQLMGANLSLASLTDANLTKAKLIEANLKDAMLQGADLSRADLLGAQLTSAILDRADLKEANLSSTILLDTSLFKVNLDEALDLSGAIINDIALQTVEPVVLERISREYILQPEPEYEPKFPKFPSDEFFRFKKKKD